jgi:hypothetical protein
VTDSVPLARRLGQLVEPIAANVYFAPEAQALYKELGLNYPQGYFASRGGSMGQVPGEVVAAAFAVFNPDLVVPMVSQAWAIADRDTILDARLQGATASLRRLLGADGAGASDAEVARATEILRHGAAVGPVAGRPLYAGLLSLGYPGTLWGDLWRAADLVREHRGDAHMAAWTSRGITAPEVLVLTEARWGIPLHSYSKTRAWPHELMASTIESLRERKLIEGEELTAEGDALREEIEELTDQAEQPVVDAIGADLDELFALLGPWSKAIVAAGGYPTDPAHLRPNA